MTLYSYCLHGTIILLAASMFVLVWSENPDNFKSFVKGSSQVTFMPL